tara:strand:+ start:163 stop:579 length:417 start_codon:yes stop_codon:yes gene_type:complete
MVDLYDWIGKGKDQREDRDLPTFKSMKEMLDYWDVTNYFGEYYGLPGDPRYSGDAFKEKKAQMEKERENEGKSDLGGGKGGEKGGKGSTGGTSYDDSDEAGTYKHGGRIKKKKRKKKGRPRGVGKALRGYGKAMKHGK